MCHLFSCAPFNIDMAWLFVNWSIPERKKHNKNPAIKEYLFFFVHLFQTNSSLVTIFQTFSPKCTLCMDIPYLCMSRKRIEEWKLISIHLFHDLHAFYVSRRHCILTEMLSAQRGVMEWDCQPQFLDIQTKCRDIYLQADAYNVAG